MITLKSNLENEKLPGAGEKLMSHQIFAEEGVPAAQDILKPLKIGGVELKNNLILAPLAGFTDAAFRQLCIEEGAGLTVTEMVSVKGLCYNNESTKELLQTALIEKPSCAQIFGSEAEFFVKALSMPQLNGFDLIDINMGCPMKKITKNGDGSALMKEPKKAAEIVEAVVKTGRTVTVKMRIGWDENSVNAIEFAKNLESAGASMVTVHGRTTAQGYTGSANWDIIGSVAAALKIPVIGNGDIKSRDDAIEKIKTYKTAGAMIGRGALGNPQIFNLEPKEKNTLETIQKHLLYMEKFFPPKYIVVNFRKHIPYYLKGLKNMRELKNEINTIYDYEVLKYKLVQALKN